MIFVWPNTLSTFSGSRETALGAGYIEIEESVYNDLAETKKMWQDGEIVDDPTYPERKRQEEEEAERRRKSEEIIKEVQRLKTELASTDYQAIKYAEGWYTEEEYAPIRATRESLREQIRALEN